MGAMGTDTGGSIRWPAAWCGIAGHKPTYGLVSKAGVLPLSFSLDHAGPMCWTAEDCALMMQVLAGHDPTDPCSADVPAPDFAHAPGNGLKGLRVGVVRHFHETDMAGDAEMVAAFEAALPVFRDLGAEVRDVTLAPFGVYLRRRQPDIALGVLRHPRALPHHHAGAVRRAWPATADGRLAAAGRDYVNAQRHAHGLVAQLAEVMRDGRCAGVPHRWHQPAPVFGEVTDAGRPVLQPRRSTSRGARRCRCATACRRAGLPLSLQIAGRPFEDPLVLKVGVAFEKATNFRAVRPDFAMGERVAAAAN